jgi:heat shock protein HslJ
MKLVCLMRALHVIATMSLAICPAQAGEAAAVLAGEWRLDRLMGAPDSDPAKSEFRLQADGAFSATVGCNRVFGRAKIEGDKARFGPVATTRMACPPPLDAREAGFLAALEAARGFRLEGERLALLNEKGEEIVAFTRN